jgi:CRP/FNR family transcriptional regulator, nitrogen fixation regulation protein
LKPTRLSLPVDLDGRRSLAGLRWLGVRTSYQRGKVICEQAASAAHWYCIVSGIARRALQRSDGRRQIIDLLLPGDFFGFTAHEEYDATVEAVSESAIVTKYVRREVEVLADSNPELAREIRSCHLSVLSR